MQIICTLSIEGSVVEGQARLQVKEAITEYYEFFGKLPDVGYEVTVGEDTVILRGFEIQNVNSVRLLNVKLTSPEEGEGIEIPPII